MNKRDKGEGEVRRTERGTRHIFTCSAGNGMTWGLFLNKLPLRGCLCHLHEPLDSSFRCVHVLLSVFPFGACSAPDPWCQASSSLWGCIFVPNIRETMREGGLCALQAALKADANRISITPRGYTATCMLTVLPLSLLPPPFRYLSPGTRAGCNTYTNPSHM